MTPPSSLCSFLLCCSSVSLLIWSRPVDMMRSKARKFPLDMFFVSGSLGIKLWGNQRTAAPTVAMLSLISLTAKATRHSLLLASF